MTAGWKRPGAGGQETRVTKNGDSGGGGAGGVSRRGVVAGAGAAGLVWSVASPAAAEEDFQYGMPFRDRFQSFRQTFRVEPDPAEAQRIVDNIIKGRPLREGLLDVTTPDIAENGNVVPVSFKVNCAMAGDDYPLAVHLVGMGNPFPEIAKYHFTPDCGEAFAMFRCRMRGSSDLVFIAEMADGSVGMERRFVSVTLGACS